MKFINRTFIVAFLMLFTLQCDLIDEDLLNSPNAPTPENVDPDFLLNNIQIEANNVYEGAETFGAELTRMLYQSGSTHANMYAPTSFNGIYSNAYADLFIDVNNLLELGVDTDEVGFYFHAGMAKTLKAYGMIVMVDLFGDMPYSEALDPTNLNPGLDQGASIYDAAIALLDEAISDFSNENRRAMPTNDFYFDAEELEADEKEEAWIRVANTIKLKALINIGNSRAADIQALIDDADNSLIVAQGQDFTYDYSTTDANPDSRHPSYSANYEDGAGAGSYMTVNYMNMLLQDKDDPDPRLRYYIYRQTTSDPTIDEVNLNTCVSNYYNNIIPSHFQPGDPYCLMGQETGVEGYWGRDYLINDGIPPDGDFRSTYGVYPAGGLFDANQNTTADRGDGEGGAGFDPVLMASYTHFLIAEAIVRFGGVSGDASTYLENGITISMETVQDFGADQADGTGFEITATTITDYVAEVDPSTPTLRKISKEFYLALWPNGYEAYNMMRRTGFPDRQDNLQPARTSQPGNWYRSLLYPATMIDRNSSVTQKSNNDILTGPFWDPNTGSTKYNF